MNNLIFFSNNKIGRQIAFILGINYKTVKKENLSKIDNEIIYVSNKKEENIVKSKNMKRQTNYITIYDLGKYLNKYNRERETKCRKNISPSYDLDEINKIPNEQLYLSEMLVKVLYSKPKDINCKELIEKCNIDMNGDLWGCCPFWISKPYGNIINDENVYNNYYARIIKLSCLNKTYCFCNLYKCKYYGKKELDNYKPNLKVRKYPKEITISIDKKCNLRCNSCRKKFYIPTKNDEQKVERITTKLLNSDILNHSDILIAGEGEVFYSESYQKILREMKNSKCIKIMSNGTLFTKEKWQILENKFKRIEVAISIDAATKDTYIKLRHGNYDELMKNLSMLSKLRKEGKIAELWFNFVVQRENMHEMKEFVKMAKKHNVDVLQFTKLNNWGTMTEEEYANKCLINGDYIDRELYNILKDPIFKDPCVNLDFFKEYINNSKILYENDNVKNI